MLNFARPNHRVTLQTVDRAKDPASKGVLETKGLIRKDGTWSASEESKLVVIELDSTRTEYVLVVPSDLQQCILAAGTASVADLNNSWFGTMDFTDVPD